MLELGVRLIHAVGTPPATAANNVNINNNNNNHCINGNSTMIMQHASNSNNNIIINNQTNGASKIITDNINGTDRVLVNNGNFLRNGSNHLASTMVCHENNRIPTSATIMTDNTHTTNNGNSKQTNGSTFHKSCLSANYLLKCQMIKSSNNDVTSKHNGSTKCKMATTTRRVPLIAQLTSVNTESPSNNFNANEILFDWHDERRRLKDYRITFWPESIRLRHCSVDTPTTSVSSASTTTSPITPASSRCITPPTPPVVTSTTRSSSTSSPKLSPACQEQRPPQISDLTGNTTSSSSSSSSSYCVSSPSTKSLSTSLKTPTTEKIEVNDILELQECGPSSVAGLRHHRHQDHRRHHHERKESKSGKHHISRHSHRKSSRHRLIAITSPKSMLDDDELEKYVDLISRLKLLRFSSHDSENIDLGDNHTTSSQLRDVSHVTGGTMFIRIDFLRRIAKLKQHHRRRTNKSRDKLKKSSKRKSSVES